MKKDCMLCEVNCSSTSSSFSNQGMYYSVETMVTLKHSPPLFSRHNLRQKKTPEAMLTRGLGRQVTPPDLKQGTISKPLQFTLLLQVTRIFGLLRAPSRNTP